MIHTMPDKTVRVTARFPKGQSIVYFDLGQAHGFTLEEDRFRPDVSVLHMLGSYSDCGARYGNSDEADADLADLNLMLADRHGHPPLPPPSGSSPMLPAPSVPLVKATHKGRAWLGVFAGLTIGVIGGHFASGWRGADVNAASPARASLADTDPYAASLLGASPAAGSPPIARPSNPQQAVSPPPPVAPARPQSATPTQAPPPGFGLQP